MRCVHKRLTTASLLHAAMFVFYLVFLVLLATAAAQSGFPQYNQGRWVITDENLEYEDTDRQSLAAVESMWSESLPEIVELVTVKDQSWTTSEPHVINEQGEEKYESAGWKIALVAAILLVSVVGSLSVAYYLCVWRGGRIHYQPQKDYA